MRRACGIAVAATLASLAGTDAARGDHGPDHSPAAEEVVELRYTAPPECPTRDAAEALIRERTPAVRFAAGAPRVFELRVAAGAQGYTGALIVDATADKQLSAQRCDDLVTALALVVALAIDPSAAAPREPEVTTTATTTMATTAPRTWTLDAALAGLLAAGPTPDLFFAVSLAGRATWPGFAAEVAIAAGRDTTQTAEARAAFTRVIARPAVCWLPVRRPLELGGCGHVELGIVRATGDDIINSRGLTRLWAAAGAHGTLRWPAATRSRGFAQLQLGVTVPISRDRYRFMPGIVIHETPPITGWIGLGVGLRFP